MKENQPNDFHEISAAKQRMNLLKNNQFIKDISYNPVLLGDSEINDNNNNNNNNKDKLPPLRNQYKSYNLDNNYENKDINTKMIIIFHQYQLPYYKIW